jgi:hypothetical protein
MSISGIALYKNSFNAYRKPCVYINHAGFVIYFLTL